MEELIKFLNPFYYLGLFFKSSENPLTSEKLSEEPLKVVEGNIKKNVNEPPSTPRLPTPKAQVAPSKSKKKVKKSK